MGNSEIEREEKLHEKFGKVFVPKEEEIKDMIIKKEIFSKSMDLDSWESSAKHQSYIYQP